MHTLYTYCMLFPRRTAYVLIALGIAVVAIAVAIVAVLVGLN